MTTMISTLISSAFLATAVYALSKIRVKAYVPVRIDRPVPRRPYQRM